MEDGRTFTSYITDSVNTMIMKQENGIKNNEEYRQFLNRNADRIMKQNKVMFESQSYVYESPDNTSLKNDNTPYLFTGINDKSKPNGYETNAVKNQYLSREQLNAKTFNRYKR